jgi:RND family efflux transporter MFP subunit
MKKIVIVAIIVIAGLVGVAFYAGMFSGEPAAQAAGQPGGEGGRGGDPGGGGFGGRGGFAGRGQARPPMTVELATVTRTSINAELTVVGNLIGEATVSVAPRAAGRLQDVTVKMGDRVSRGQRIAKIEDFELQEQVKQQEAAQQVSQATIRQREADLALAKTNVERSRSLFERQLLPKQTLDDNEARYQSALAALDLARAQNAQSKARLDELQINLANTIITSPVNGFVSRRAVDPGAFVSQNAPIVDVVDITSVRLVANVVERDLKELQAGDTTKVEVDAYPGETFTGRIARVSIEIQILNRDYRLKPGMYARVSIMTDTRKDALVVPSAAIADLGGRRGVFQVLNDSAVFRTVQVGSELPDMVEILGGIEEGEQVITTGARALRDGDRVIIAGADGPSDGPVRGPRSGGSAGSADLQQPLPGAAPVEGRGRRGTRPAGASQQ